MRANEPTTTVAIRPETASQFNDLKKELDKQKPYRVTADVLLQMLINAFTGNKADIL